jgi:hypothetical protein
MVQHRNERPGASIHQRLPDARCEPWAMQRLALLGGDRDESNSNLGHFALVAMCQPLQIATISNPPREKGCKCTY